MKIDYKGILEGIRDGSPFTIGLSIDEYIEGLKRRVKLMYGEELNTESYKSIVEDLKRLGEL